MTRLGKCLAVGAGVVVIIPVALYVALWLFFSAKYVPSNIMPFHPEPFPAKANANFFYSIGNELKYSDHIDPESPTLMRGHIDNFLVSPDSKKIAAVVNGELVVIETDSVLRKVAAVDSIWKEPKPIGRQFFRDDDFQWSKDSNELYLIRDEYYDSRGAQLFSNKGELWKYDLESGSLQLVLKPFKAFDYFFGINSGIYFSEPTDRGDLQLRYFDGNRVTSIAEPNAHNIPVEKLGRNFIESPFYSFSIIEYERALHSKGVDLVIGGSGGPQTLMIRGKSYLTITEGQGFKGSHYCSEMIRSMFLPGDRYFLFNADYCGNYNGQLLIDTVTGKYQGLPANSVVYLTLNTDTYPNYRIAGEGIVVK